jgi:short-subunit dehydrogenase
VTEISGTVLLTGATGGIGHAIARALAARGAQLVLTGRRTEVLEPLAAETGGRAVAADLSQPDAVPRLLAEVGEVDILVANAGLSASGLLESFTPEQIDRAIDVNLRVPMQLARAVAQPMIARRRGHIVFMSSLSGMTASPGAPLYSATKFGLRGFAGALREDLRGHGIGVSAIFPGFVSDAGMFADAHLDLPFGVGTSTPEEVADAVVRGIERNRGEIMVAPLSMKVGTVLGATAPAIATRVQRRLGGDIAGGLAKAHRDKLG